MNVPNAQLVPFRLIGGPMGGQIVMLPRGCDHFDVGPRPAPFFRYTFAGREGRQPMLASLPKSRAQRRMIRQVVEASGKDPRVEYDAAKRAPLRYPRDTSGRKMHPLCLP
jgi:hypothetical protein